VYKRQELGRPALSQDRRRASCQQQAQRLHHQPRCHCGEATLIARLHQQRGRCNQGHEQFPRTLLESQCSVVEYFCLGRAGCLSPIDPNTVGDTKGTSRPDPQRGRRSPMSLPFVIQDRCARFNARNRRFAVDFSSARSRRWKADSPQGVLQ
jgi:hypothetical protein